MALTSEDIKKFGPILLDLVPADGTPKSNKDLLLEFTQQLKAKEITISDDDYWEVRNSLIADGRILKARGRGGSVYRLIEKTEKTKMSGAKKEKKTEKDLYQPFYRTINEFWVKEKDIKHFVIDKTASQGKKKTGGKWTRPDVTLVAIRTYAFVPGKLLEVITFEIKPADEFDVAGVFETAAHSVYAHKSYLAIECPDGRPEVEEFDRVEFLCKRFGVGLIIFADVIDWDTYEEIVEPERKNPDPGEVNVFLRTQISKENQNSVLELLK